MDARLTELEFVLQVLKRIRTMYTQGVPDLFSFPHHENPQMAEFLQCWYAIGENPLRRLRHVFKRYQFEFFKEDVTDQFARAYGQDGYRAFPVTGGVVYITRNNATQLSYDNFVTQVSTDFVDSLGLRVKTSEAHDISIMYVQDVVKFVIPRYDTFKDSLP